MNEGNANGVDGATDFADVAAGVVVNPPNERLDGTAGGFGATAEAVDSPGNALAGIADADDELVVVVLAPERRDFSRDAR